MISVEGKAEVARAAESCGNGGQRILIRNADFTRFSILWFPLSVLNDPLRTSATIALLLLVATVFLDSFL